MWRRQNANLKKLMCMETAELIFHARNINILFIKLFNKPLYEGLFRHQLFNIIINNVYFKSTTRQDFDSKACTQYATHRLIHDRWASKSPSGVHLISRANGPNRARNWTRRDDRYPWLFIEARVLNISGIENPTTLNLKYGGSFIPLH